MLELDESAALCELSGSPLLFLVNNGSEIRFPCSDVVSKMKMWFSISVVVSNMRLSGYGG